MVFAAFVAPYLLGTTMRFVEAYHEMTNLRSKGLLPEQVVLSVLV